MSQLAQSTAPPPPRRYTVDEYLDVAEKGEGKKEYYDGVIRNMPGGSFEHAAIILNVGTAISNRLRGGPCRAYSPELRIVTPRSRAYCYPDVTVVCGGIIADPVDRSGHTATNPTLVVEVLSPTTEGFDRTTKFRRYLEIESLREHVLVSQDAAWVETYFRQDDGTWLFGYLSGVDSTAKLRSIGIDLPLGEIYDGVVFPAEPPAGPPPA